METDARCVVLTGVARCGLNDHALSRNELSFRLCGFNHALRNAVLDRPAGGRVFKLANCVPFIAQSEYDAEDISSENKRTEVAFQALMARQPVQADEWRITDGVERGVKDNCRS